MCLLTISSKLTKSSNLTKSRKHFVLLITLILIGQEYPYSANEMSGNRSFHWYQTLDWLKGDLTVHRDFLMTEKVVYLLVLLRKMAK